MRLDRLLICRGADRDPLVRSWDVTITLLFWLLGIEVIVLVAAPVMAGMYARMHMDRLPGPTALVLRVATFLAENPWRLAPVFVGVPWAFGRCPARQARLMELVVAVAGATTLLWMGWALTLPLFEVSS